LEASLGSRYSVIEEGLNGRTLASEDPFSEGRNGRAYLLPCLWSHAPVDIVLIMLGTNDLKDTFRLSASDIARGAELLVNVAKRTLAGPGESVPKIGLIAPPPIGPAMAIASSSGLAGAVERSRLLASLYREVAEATSAVFLDAGEVVSVSALDGIHLDAVGHRALGLAVADVVGRLESRQA
jgi:lysophospholipase L1-like esterase